jgi:hypothetical protein
LDYSFINGLVLEFLVSGAKLLCGKLTYFSAFKEKANKCLQLTVKSVTIFAKRKSRKNCAPFYVS